MKYNTDELQFELKQEEIDYFKIEEDMFKPVAEKHLLNLGADEYLKKDKHLSTLNNDKETVVLNFQVGKGKTTLCYDLMEEYYNNGYFVVVCSPFKRLVQKDYQEMSNRLYKMFKGFLNVIPPGKRSLVAEYNSINYFDPSYDMEGSLTLATRFRFHIMTINTFMGNPGENSLVASRAKQQYLKSLWNRIKKEDYKVVLFFDEVQESVYNFKSEFIPYILKWKQYVEKVFISSASFTPATIPMIKALSLLTDKKVRILEAPRQKNKTQSNISLHLSNFPLHSKEPQLLSQIDFLVKEYNKKGRPINIICGTKTLAESLSEKCYGKNIIEREQKGKDQAGLKYVYLLTADTENSYQTGQNNIGTTFKAGVNIASDQEVLIIVFPSIVAGKKHSHYGIFSDGISSIIQALGRQRNGGDIHLIMYEPSTLLGINEDYPANYGKKECIDHLPFNESLPLLQKKYLKILREFDLEIRYMEIENAKAALFLPLQKKRLAFHFHNENEYLLKHSQSILRAHHNPSFGQSLSPYVFWCCINNQLINATLKKVFRLSKSGPIPLTAKNINSTLINIIKSKEAEIISCSFRESLDQISNILDTTINDDGDLIENKFIYDTKHSTASVLLNRNKEVNRLAVQALLSVYEKDEQFPDDATTYLNACLEEIKSFIKTKGPKNDLIEGYISLAQSKLAIWDFIETNRVEKDGKFYLKNNQYKQVSKTIIDEANKALVNIKTHDKILKENVISFLQNHTYTGKDSEKKKIFNLLTELSYKVGSRKDIGGESFKEIIPLPSSNPLSYQLIT